MDLNREKLFNLMSRMRSLVPPEPAGPDCTDVLWTVPYHFDAIATERLTDFANAMAEFMQRTLRVLCDDTFEVNFDAVTEHYACLLAEQVEQDNNNHYFMPLSIQGKGPVGFMGFPFETCTQLIGQMLRDPESGIGEDAQLSALEESVLHDIIIMIADSLCEGFSAYGEILLEKTEQILHGCWPVPFRQLDDMCRISFQAGTEEVPLEISLYLLDSVIDSLVGASMVQTAPEHHQKTPEQIAEYLGDATAETTVWLSPSMMAFQDILTLEEGDLVLLDHKVSTPVDVQVNGRECFKAWPAQSAGRGAVVLADPSTDP
ncbi:MAG: FliM/FliN family flagellar motor switch protein [Planctomycetota bacterium]|jgi:flagellar motor switch protein FliM